MLRQRMQLGGSFRARRIATQDPTECVRRLCPSLGQFEQMAQLQMGIGRVRCPLTCRDIGSLCTVPVTGFLESVPQLNP